MANVVVTTDISSPNVIKISWGVYGGKKIDGSVTYLNKNIINTICDEGGFISVKTSDRTNFHFSHQEIINKPNVMVVDSVNGVVPTSTAELADMIQYLM